MDQKKVAPPPPKGWRGLVLSFFFIYDTFAVCWKVAFSRKFAELAYFNMNAIIFWRFDFNRILKTALNAVPTRSQRIAISGTDIRLAPLMLAFCCFKLIFLLHLFSSFSLICPTPLSGGEDFGFQLQTLAADAITLL
jgi:hypothetical protein